MLETLTDPADLEALVPEWRELWRNDARATPFQSPEWLLAWSRLMFRGGQFWAVAQRRESRLVSLLPCFRWGPRLENLSLLGAGISDYLDVLGEPIDRIPGDFEVADLQELRGSSPLLNLGQAEAWSTCPVLRLPSSFDEVLAGMESKFRTDTRRARNRMAREESSIMRTSDPTALFRLHSARWQERNEAGVLAGPEHEAFHREVVDGFEKLGILRLYELRIRDDAIATIYAFAHRGRWYAYLNGFDPGYAKLSPCVALLAHVIEDAIREGAREFDFLRGREEYKYKWGAADSVNYRVVLRARASAFA